MAKVIRLTETDLHNIVSRIIKEQMKSPSNVPLLTKFVQKFLPLDVNWKLAGPTDYDYKMAFAPSSKDLMIGGFEGKPLVFIHGKKPGVKCFLKKDGKTIMCSALGDLKSFDLNSQFGEFEKWLTSVK